MSYQDFLPANWIKDRKSDDHPLAILRKEVDDLFDDFGNGFFNRSREVAIHSNVSETDKEYCITAELPGMTEADVDVSITGERIVIKGDKKSETEEGVDVILVREGHMTPLDKIEALEEELENLREELKKYMN